ncbi:MAG: TrkA family potassium uptake protein [Bacillota bacterium]|nr:TrkA family potassium uptake protein [Bacillota bacterium]
MKQYAVIGLGRFGRSMVQTLREMGCDVLGIDSNEDRVEAVVDIATHAVQADTTDEETLKELGIRNFDIVIVAIGKDIKASILTTVLVKELGVKLVIAKALSDLHGKVLERVGADRVVYPEREMAIRVAHNIESGNVLDYIELSRDHSIVEVKAKPEYYEKTLAKLDFRARYGISIMAIKRENGDIIVGPGGETVIMSKDIIVAMGTKDKLRMIE